MSPDPFPFSTDGLVALWMEHRHDRPVVLYDDRPIVTPLREPVDPIAWAVIITAGLAVGAGVAYWWLNR